VLLFVRERGVGIFRACGVIPGSLASLNSCLVRGGGKVGKGGGGNNLKEM